MNRIALALLLALPVMAHDPWTTEDTIVESLCMATTVIDWRQTLDVKRHPEKRELNPILGVHPTDQRINKHFAVCALLHPAIAYMLPREYRHGFQYLYLGVELGAMGNNYAIGLMARF